MMISDRSQHFDHHMRRLRRHESMLVNKIALQLGLSLGLVSIYERDIQLSESQSSIRV